MTSDEVYLHLPEVDMWDSTSRDLFVALDEGCNTTCHSEAWASMAESKLKGYGLDMPWISEQGKSFLGLGASTKTQGQRTIPFCIVAQEWRSCDRDNGQSPNYGAPEDTIVIVVVCTGLIRTYLSFSYSGARKCRRPPPGGKKTAIFEECLMCIKHRKYRQKWPLGGASLWQGAESQKSRTPAGNWFF